MLLFSSVNVITQNPGGLGLLFTVAFKGFLLEAFLSPSELVETLIRISVTLQRSDGFQNYDEIS